MSCISFVVTFATSLRSVLQFQEDEEIRRTSQEFSDILRKSVTGPKRKSGNTIERKHNTP